MIRRETIRSAIGNSQHRDARIIEILKSYTTDFDAEPNIDIDEVFEEACARFPDANVIIDFGKNMRSRHVKDVVYLPLTGLYLYPRLRPISISEDAYPDIKESAMEAFDFGSKEEAMAYISFFSRSISFEVVHRRIEFVGKEVL